MVNERLVSVFADLEKTLKDFIVKHHITHDEYRAFTKTIDEVVRAGEGFLLFDVFLENASTDATYADRPGTVEAIEGPFYLPGAPPLERPYVMPQRPDEEGDVLIFGGQVRSSSGEPLPGAEIDMWHADAKGDYSGFAPGVPEWNLRGRFLAGYDGTFEVRTIVPPPYEIPKEGPTGRLLRALGRHCFRPAHLHLKVRHPGYVELCTQLFMPGDPWLDSDVAGAVKDSLVAELAKRDDPAAIRGRGLDRPFFETRYDLVLAPASLTTGA